MRDTQSFRDEDGAPAVAKAVSMRHRFMARLALAAFWGVLTLVVGATVMHGYSHYCSERAVLDDRRLQAEKALNGMCASANNVASPYAGCKQARLDAQIDVMAVAAEHTALHLLGDINPFRLLGDSALMGADGAGRYLMLQSFSTWMWLWLPLIVLVSVGGVFFANYFTVGAARAAWAGLRISQAKLKSEPPREDAELRTRLATPAGMSFRVPGRAAGAALASKPEPLIPGYGVPTQPAMFTAHRQDCV